MNDEPINKAPEGRNAQPQGAQIQLGGGLIPQPDGSWIAHMFFSQLPNEQVARQFMTQLDTMVKQMFSAPPSTQQ